MSQRSELSKVKSFAQVFWLRKCLSSAFLDFKYGDFILYILPFMSLTQENKPMPFGIHTNGFFTENVSTLKKDNLACGDTCLASHILPILIFPHLFFLSVYLSYNIYHCLNQIVCLLLLGYSMLSFKLHVSSCLICRHLYPLIIEY